MVRPTSAAMKSLLADRIGLKLIEVGAKRKANIIAEDLVIAKYEEIVIGVASTVALVISIHEVKGKVANTVDLKKMTVAMNTVA